MTAIRQRLEVAQPAWYWLRRLPCRLAWQCSPKVIVIRHGDYDGATPGNPDPPLNQDGELRANELLHVLEKVGITHIFTTEYQRTQDTAAPTASSQGINPTVVSASNTSGLLKKIRKLPTSAAVLVVGHSNTAPDVVAGLGGGQVQPIQATEFDRLFVVGHRRVFELSYGAPT